MSKCFGFIAVTFGVIVFSSVGQAQNKTDYEKSEPNDQSENPKIFPITVPVKIIISDASTESRQRRESESRQREIDDLIAQQGMNSATQAMNEDTQRMALYSFISTVIVGSELFF